MFERKIKADSKNELDFKVNVGLARNIKGNLEYLYKKFPSFKDLDINKHPEDTGILYFISSYFSSENILLNDDVLIVYDSKDIDKFYAFYKKKLYVFEFDKQNDEASVELFNYYQIVSIKLNYDSIEEGIFRLNYKGKGFSNADFINSENIMFDNTKNPKVSSFTLKFNFFELNISSSNSNLSIESIADYIEEKL